MRNGMEHKTFHITDELNAKDIDSAVYSKSEIVEKTKILMWLVKAAILSFGYLVRKQSKIKASELTVEA